MNTIIITLLGILVILNLGTLMILIYRISSLLRDIKELRNTEIIESKLLHSQNLSVQESHKLMEYLVSTYFAEWRIYNVDPDSENYMTEASQKNAMNYCVKRIIENMTDTIKQQLSIGYKMDTNEDMIKSILSVVKIHVISYSVEQNNYTIDNKHMPNFNTF